MDFDNALDLFKRTLATERSRPDVHTAMLELAQPDTIGAVSTQIQQALARGERIWMTADLHLCHANVMQYCNRKVGSRVYFSRRGPGQGFLVSSKPGPLLNGRLISSRIKRIGFTPCAKVRKKPCRSRP